MCCWKMHPLQHGAARRAGTAKPISLRGSTLLLCCGEAGHPSASIIVRKSLKSSCIWLLLGRCRNNTGSRLDGLPRHPHLRDVAVVAQGQKLLHLWARVVRDGRKHGAGKQPHQQAQTPPLPPPPLEAARQHPIRTPTPCEPHTWSSRESGSNKS